MLTLVLAAQILSVNSQAGVTQIRAELERCQQQQLVMKIEVIPKREWEDKIVAGSWVPQRACFCVGASACGFPCGCLCVCGCNCVYV